MKKNSRTGLIFDVQRFSIHDGPGIRTTIFLKGCPMKCPWCHNPESISSEKHLSFLAAKCIGCGFCVRICEHGAHEMLDGEHLLDRNKCLVCGKCAEECYAQALEIVGRVATVDELIDEVLKDKPFYETSGGGMTISGGEPMHQPEFTLELLMAAKNHDVHTAIETNGFASWKNFERILEYTDLFLFDYKETDPEKHAEFTGVPRETVVKNLKKLYKANAEIVLRCPIIPGHNDREEHFEAIADIAKAMPGINGVELMPYHSLGAGKLERFGFDPESTLKAETPEDEQVEKWKQTLRDAGVKVL